MLDSRDFPKWSVLSLTPKVEPQTYGGPKKISKYFLDYFCTNLSCVIGFCTMHDQACELPLSYLLCYERFAFLTVSSL